MKWWDWMPWSSFFECWVSSRLFPWWVGKGYIVSAAAKSLQLCLTLWHRQQPTRLPRPWDSPGKNTGVGCHFLLQRIFLTQGLNPGLLHCRQMLYHLSHQGSPRSKCLLISWLQSPSAVILEPTKIKSATVSLFPHLYALKWWDRMPWS